MKIEDIAKIVHEANKAYCEAIGDFSQVQWHLAEGWQKGSAVAGIQHIIDNPDAKPEDSHESWLKMKEAEGWKFGKLKNPAIKQHPCMVPYDKLPPEQLIKDELFVTLAKLLIPELTSTKLKVVDPDKAIKPEDKKVEMNSADKEAIDMEFKPALKKKANEFIEVTKKNITKKKDTSK